MWYELKGTVKRLAGTGAFSTPFAAGTRILQIKFVGAGTCTVPTGDGVSTQTITGVAAGCFDLLENHTDFILGSAGGTGAQLEIQFSSGVTAWFIEYIGPPGAS